MPSFLNTALKMFSDAHCELIYLDEAMFPDPIVPAKYAELFEALHTLYCLDTGADPAYYNIHRILNWMGKARHVSPPLKAMAAHA